MKVKINNKVYPMSKAKAYSQECVKKGGEGKYSPRPHFYSILFIY